MLHRGVLVAVCVAIGALVGFLVMNSGLGGGCTPPGPGYSCDFHGTPTMWLWGAVGGGAVGLALGTALSLFISRDR